MISPKTPRSPLIKSFLLLILILFVKCAAQQSPSGGKKDTIPPKLIFSFPKNKSTNFKANFIELEFDEYIQIESGIHQQLIITPNIETWGHRPTKKGIKIEFEKGLKSNTTYTFNFRQSISDLNEKNPAQNLKLVFSTGPQLDSISIYGNVKDMLTGKPIENGLVSLYIANDTSVINKHKPFYFTKTSKDGHYEIENLKEGEYKMYALTDQNNNLTYQNETEKIDFLPEILHLKGSMDNINFSVAKIDKTSPKIVVKTNEDKYYDIEFNKGIIDFNIESAADIAYMPLDTKVLRLYNIANKLDSIPLKISAVDSSGNELKKEIKIKFAEEKKEEQNKRKEKGKIKKNPFPFEIKVEPGNGGKIGKELVIKISSNKPVKSFDVNKIQLLADTIKQLPIEESEFNWNKYHSQWKLNKKIRINKLIRFEAEKGAFMSIEGDSSTKIKNDYELKIADEYGSIGGKVETKNTLPFIIQLISQDKLISEVFNTKTFKFEYLEAGEYQLRIVIDRNNNKKWDAGDMQSLERPEEIIYHNKLIKLKQDWEIEEDLKF